MDINTQTGALELNDVYTSLVDWTTEPVDVISPNIDIMGIVGLGVKEITKDTTLTRSENIDNRIINNISGVLPYTNVNIIQMDNSATDSSLWDLKENRFQSYSLFDFPDCTKICVSFWSNISENQLYRNSVETKEETVFQY